MRNPIILANDRTFAFAAAMPPRSELNFPSDQWLRAVAKAGYSHVCLQADPFLHPEMQLRDTGENTFRLLSLYDIVTGPRRRSYQAWLASVGDRAAAFGLRLTLELWEPRLSRHARQVLPAAWKGPAMFSGWVEPLCLGVHDARAWLIDGFRTLLRSSGRIDCLVLGINDNNAFLCRDCLRCKEPEVERLASLYGDIESACLEVNPDFRMVVYDWMWDDRQYDAVLPRLKQRPFVLTRMERGVDYTPDPAHPEWHGSIFDQYLGNDQTGNDFRKAKISVSRHGGDMLVMPTLSGMFEAFYLPYVPAVGQVAKKFDTMRREGVSGWVDFDCGGICEGLILDLVETVQHHPAASPEEWAGFLAATRYGARACATASRIWNIFDRAVKLSPNCLSFKDINCFSGTYAGTMNLVIGHPFLPQRIGNGAYARKFIYQNDPHWLATRESIPAMRHFMRLMVSTASDVLALYPRLVDESDEPLRRNAEFDFLISRMVILSWRSNVNFFDWAAAINGDASVDKAAVLSDEISTVRAYRELCLDPRVEHGNSTHAFERNLALSVPQASADLYHAVECDGLASWIDPNPYPVLSGDFFAWKIANLEYQLAEMK